MQQRQLGTNGPLVSSLGLGCIGMSEFYKPTNEHEALATIHHALALGINFLDTTDQHEHGYNEELIGRAIRDRRDQVILATKCGIIQRNDGNVQGANGSPEYVHTSCNASLRRLKIEYIDLYYLHRLDPQVPIEETIGAMAGLVAAGKVRHIGLSEAPPTIIRRANAIYHITALRTEYSLWSRDVERETLPTCRELGIGLVPYSPQGRGMLARQIHNLGNLSEQDDRSKISHFQAENFAQNQQLVCRLEEIAREKKCKPAQLALAWVLAQGADIVPISGIRRRVHLEENLAALMIQLTSTDLSRIDEVLP
jgi:aryl-alcohol dehydrogenase-like predicted oxidoreductase